MPVNFLPVSALEGGWSSALPHDAMAIGDIVVDKSMCTIDKIRAKAKLAETKKVMGKEVLSPDLERNLIAIENSLRDESQQIEKMRQKIESIAIKCFGSPSRQIPTGLPICGIIEYLDAPNICLNNGKYVDQSKDCRTTHLVCKMIVFLPKTARAALRVASKAVRDRFKGLYEIVSTRVTFENQGRSSVRNANGDIYGPFANFVEVRPRISSGLRTGFIVPSFIVAKKSIKVCSLRPGDEVFFRPRMNYVGGYDQYQDWPRGRIMAWQDEFDKVPLHDSLCADENQERHPAVRPNGFVVIKTWSWRLTCGSGAFIFARWADVRRARHRAKYQMLPEQRVMGSLCKC